MRVVVCVQTSLGNRAAERNEKSPQINDKLSFQGL